MSKLVVVESPTKAKTLSKFLGDGFETVSSMGHVRDLPKSELGVDVEHDFAPNYLVAKGKTKVVQDIKRAAKKADTLFLATDPDREGEAIAWHIAQVLADHMPPMKRVVFHEITESAVMEAFKHPRDIDLELVDSQQGRRVLDRLVGYKLSPLLWKKVRYGLSAGRVQSVAVRLIVERERERDKFQPSEYWTVKAKLFQGKRQKAKGKEREGEGERQEFEAELDSVSGKPLAAKEKINLFDGEYEVISTSIGNKKKAGEVVNQLRDEKFIVENIESRDQKRHPYPPFTTSTMQRAAVNYLGFSARRTMRAAQRLYEAGLITYHRTDSTALADRALKEFRDFVGSNYGSNYLPETAIRYKTKVRLAQEAHEAIRPTSAEVTGDKLSVTGDEKKLYDLIWKRAVSCQMAPAILALTRVDIKADNCLFKAHGSQIKFDGFLKVLGKAQETILPPLKKGDGLSLISLDPTQHFSSPPPRYTEASLIKSLEERGIGRPSTYAPIISTVQDRGYVSKEGKQLRPEDVGTVVNDLLVAYFPKIVDLSFTAKMEGDLDGVANGKREWVPMVREFYGPFAEDLSEAEKNIEKSSVTTLEETAEKCPECGKPLVIKLGKYGRFYSCSGFPECKFTKPFIKKIGMRCPGCKDGEVIVKRTRRGKIFYGCSRYPDCNWASWRDPRRETPEKEGGTDAREDASG